MSCLADRASDRHCRLSLAARTGGNRRATGRCCARYAGQSIYAGVDMRLRCGRRLFLRGEFKGLCDRSHAGAGLGRYPASGYALPRFHRQHAPQVWRAELGLDGLIPIKYHVLSHIWLGCLGLWLGVSTLDAYYIGAQIIAIPLLLFSLALATHLLRSPETGSADGALVTLVPLLLLFIVDLWGWTSYLVSESYFLAMILFLLSLPLLAEIAADQFRLRASLQVAALVIVGILMLVSKVSVGVIFWGASWFFALATARLDVSQPDQAGSCQFCCSSGR